MGAQDFTSIGFGRTVGEAEKNLCDAALREFGHQDGYNGTITTTHFCGVVDFEPTKKFTKAKLHRFADHVLGRWVRGEHQEGIGDKRECRAMALPKSYAKGQGRNVKAWLFVGIGAC